jgi:thiol-disulfide isomerase/thioredoxin
VNPNFQNSQAQERLDNRYFNHMQNQHRGGYHDPGFQIYDQSRAPHQGSDSYKGAESGRVIYPSDNKFGNRASYEQSVSKLTSYDHTNAHEAVKKAAAEGQGVAFIIGSQSTKDTQKLLDQMTKMKEQNPGMQFVFIDKDKVNEQVKNDPNSTQAKKWQNWIQQNTGGSDLAFTSLQSVKPGEGGKPVVDRVVSTHWGGDIQEGLRDQSRFAKSFTGAHQGQFKITEEPAAKKTSETSQGNADTSRTTDTAEKPNSNNDKKEQAAVYGMTEGEKEALNKERHNGNDTNFDKRTKNLFDQAREHAKKTGKPLVINFETENCIPCKKKQAEALPEMSKELAGKATILNMDPNSAATEKMLKDHGISMDIFKEGFPATGIFSIDANNQAHQQGEVINGYSSKAYMDKQQPGSEAYQKAMSYEKLMKKINEQCK